MPQRNEGECAWKTCKDVLKKKKKPVMEEKWKQFSSMGYNASQ